MHNVARKQAADVVEDVLHELDRLVVADAQDVLFDAPHDARMAGGKVFRTAGKFWIGRKSREHVPRQFDLRNDGDMPLRGVGDDLPYVGLRVVVRAVLHAI